MCSIKIISRYEKKKLAFYSKALQKKQNDMLFKMPNELNCNLECSQSTSCTQDGQKYQEKAKKTLSSIPTFYFIIPLENLGFRQKVFSCLSWIEIVLVIYKHSEVGQSSIYILSSLRNVSGISQTVEQWGLFISKITIRINY